MSIEKKRNLLFVTRDFSYPGGTERFFIDLVIHASRFSDFTVHTLDTEGTGIFNPDTHQEMESAGAKVIRTRNHGNQFWDIYRAKQLVDIIEKRNIDIVHSALFNPDFIVLLAKLGSKQVRPLLESFSCYKRLLQICPEITDADENTPSTKLFKWVSTKFCSFSVALEENTPAWTVRKKIIDHKLEPIVSTHADISQLVSSNQFKKWRNWSESTELTPCCSLGEKDLIYIESLKEQRNQLRLELHLSDACKVFCTASRLVPGKGLELLVESFLEHIRNHPQDILIIAGSGQIEEQLKQMAGNHPNIFFTGFIPREELFKIFIASDVGLLLSESEGLPLSIQEMMGCSLPVIATNVGGIPELVNSKNGILVEPNNTIQIKHAFNKIVAYSDEQLAELGSNSLKKIERNFIKERVFTKILQSYEQS